MNPAEIQKLAQAINIMRPDWPTASLRSFIASNMEARPLRDAAVALMWIACDPDTRTPARVLEAGPWWVATMADRRPENQPTPTPPRFVPTPPNPDQADINRQGAAQVRAALTTRRSES